MIYKSNKSYQILSSMRIPQAEEGGGELRFSRQICWDLCPGSFTYYLWDDQASFQIGYVQSLGVHETLEEVKGYTADNSKEWISISWHSVYIYFTQNDLTVKAPCLTEVSFFFPAYLSTITFLLFYQERLFPTSPKS